jgi:hypothetical protein
VIGIVMNYEDASFILEYHMALFRLWPYSSLAARLGPHTTHQDRLATIEGRSETGGEYFIEVNLCWEHKPHAAVRVFGDSTTDERVRVHGHPELATPTTCVSFIKSPNESFVDQ